MVRRSKRESSHRTIPLNAPALKAIARMVERLDALGFTEPDHYVWMKCQWNKLDPTVPATKWDTAWRALRKAAALPGLRFYDLRHTVITELCEMGVPEETIMAIAGHLSRRMLEHYSHIRILAKRKALDDLDRLRAERREQSHTEGAPEQVQ